MECYKPTPPLAQIDSFHATRSIHFVAQQEGFTGFTALQQSVPPEQRQRGFP